MSEENADEHPPGEPEEQRGDEQTRRVRPLFRFGRRSKKEDAPEEVQEPGAPAPQEDPGEEAPFVEATDDPEDGTKAPVRPVRVVKFIPPAEDPATTDAPEHGETPFSSEDETPFTEEGQAPFDVEEGPTFVYARRVPMLYRSGAWARAIPLFKRTIP